MIIFQDYVPHQFAVDPGLEPFRFIHWNIKVVESAISKERSRRDELQKNKYIVIKEAVPKQIAEFVYNYFLLKKKLQELYLIKNIYLISQEWGVWNDKQVPNTYSLCRCSYETLL